MRALILVLNIGVLGLALYFGSWTAWLVAAAVCFLIIAAFFKFSMARTEARESREMQRSMGRNTTFLAGLFGSNGR